MTIHHGDCVEVMAGMEPESVDAIVTDPPYGLEFMGKEWDRLGDVGTTSHGGPAAVAAGERGQYGKVSYFGSSNLKCRNCGKWRWDHVGRKCECERPDFPNAARHQGLLMQDWHTRWATEALSVAKPGAYLLAFGGTRTAHRLAVAIEDAGWIIRDTLMWVYASGFPKSRANLKPAYEPIVMARKPGPLRMLDIEGCRIGTDWGTDPTRRGWQGGNSKTIGPTGNFGMTGDRVAQPNDAGRWPANLILTNPVFDGGWEGVVGGGMQSGGGNPTSRGGLGYHGANGQDATGLTPVDTSGTYSRFFLIPKASRRDREPSAEAAERLTHTLDGGVWGGAEDDLTPGKKRTIARVNTHPTVKPTALMRHLVRLVTPQGGVVLDPFLGSGSTAKAAILEGFEWVGIEQSAEYIAIAEARIDGLAAEPVQVEMTA